MRGPLSRRKKMKVLIADDSKVVVERLADLLRDVAGLEVIGKAGDAPQAILSIRQMNPDAVILDLQMPGGSGLDVLRAVRPDHPNMFVLVCTNYPYPQFREECLAAGADFFLDKSTEFEKLPVILGDFIKSLRKPASAVR
jgi:DNA-binding NarL/FixJ family response regulator